MPKRHLTAGQIDLLHHVELSDAGWRDRAVSQLVVAKALSSPQPVGIEAIRGEVAASVGDSVGADEVERALRRLLDSRALYEVSNGLYAPSQSTRSDAERKKREAASAEEAAHGLFESLITEHAPGFVDRAWPWFCDHFLKPMIDVLGARTYELLAQVNGDDDQIATLGSYLRSVPEAFHDGVHRAVTAFFATQDPLVRQFVLRHLHAHLLALAVALPPRSLDALQARVRSGIRLQVFLDTNFLFSILDLHDNPANEAAREFVKLLETIRNRVNVTLYVSPLTVDECRRTLAAYEAKLRDIPISPKLGGIAASIDGEFSGITLRFLSAARATRHRLTAKEFFDPYLSNFVAVLRGRNIELYNKSMDDLTTSQPVIDDILSQQDFEKSKAQKRAKSYEALRHDVTLWHLAAGLRPTVTEMPLDAGYWIATVDFRFLGFDAHKRHTTRSHVPVCVHPVALVQMLQLWLPRTPEVERAVFESLGAMIPQFFDSEAEEMSIRILRALSRLEDVDDLPEQTVTSLLLNKALQRRMLGDKELEQQVALVKDAIVSQVIETEEAFKKEQAKALALSQELESLSAESGRRATKNDEERSALQRTLDLERTSAAELSHRLGALETTVQSQRDQHAHELGIANQRHSRHVFVWQLVAVAVILVLFAILGTRSIDFYLPSYHIRGLWLFGSFGVATWLTVARVLGGRSEGVNSWTVYRQTKALAVFLLTSAWAVFISVIGNVVYKYILSN